MLKEAPPRSQRGPAVPRVVQFSRQWPGGLLPPALGVPRGLKMTAALPAFLSQRASSHVRRHAQSDVGRWSAGQATGVHPETLLSKDMIQEAGMSGHARTTSDAFSSVDY